MTGLRVRHHMPHLLLPLFLLKLVSHQTTAFHLLDNHLLYSTVRNIHPQQAYTSLPRGHAPPTMYTPPHALPRMPAPPIMYTPPHALPRMPAPPILQGPHLAPPRQPSMMVYMPLHHQAGAPQGPMFQLNDPIGVLSTVYGFKQVPPHHIQHGYRLNE